MAVFYITEYAAVGLVPGTRIPVPQEPPIAEQTVAIGVGSTQSASFNVKTVLVRLHTDAICSKLVGANPTALATSGRMGVNTTEYIALDKQTGADSALKIAVIQNS